jgi:hypothetical protein
MKVWGQCAMCDEYYCEIHREHVAECSCPGIDVWSESPHCPYDSEVTPEVIKWVQDNPHKDEW